MDLDINRTDWDCVNDTPAHLKLCGVDCCRLKLRHLEPKLVTRAYLENIFSLLLLFVKNCKQNSAGVSALAAERPDGKKLRNKVSKTNLAKTASKVS